jgi:hypothetical protein
VPSFRDLNELLLIKVKNIFGDKYLKNIRNQGSAKNVDKKAIYVEKKAKYV